MKKTFSLSGARDALPVTRRHLLLGSIGIAAGFLELPSLAVIPAHQVQVYKNASCGCCGAWAAHMRSAGFDVSVTEVDDTTAIRKRLGMPDRFGSCHTATIDGYVLEGHVPAVEVKRLLEAKPNAIGLAVPSMPPGSPGMEMGSRKDPYQVLLIDRAGKDSVFASYPQIRTGEIQ
jgi:hypothetical protein